jgi:hypothetical protein
MEGEKEKEREERRTLNLGSAFGVSFSRIKRISGGGRKEKNAVRSVRVFMCVAVCVWVWVCIGGSFNTKKKDRNGRGGNGEGQKKNINPSL